MYVIQKVQVPVPQYLHSPKVETQDLSTLMAQSRATGNQHLKLVTCHLGYQYNVAGYMALKDGSYYTEEVFGYQGICPNGWHIPTRSEFETLEKSVGSNPGKALKATSGWSQDSGNTDKYGFYALPAGNLDPTTGTITYVGLSTSFATATPMDGGYSIACVNIMGGGSGKINYQRTAKYVSLSVRCVKD